MSNLQAVDRLNILLTWCAANFISIDSQIHIASDEQYHGGIGVYSTEAFIPPNHTLVRIPKTAILSVRSCSLAEHIPFSPYGLEAQLTLSLALYVELLLGTQSRWHGYLQSLPAGVVDLPMFWCLDTDTSQDARDALSWLRGTEASKVIDAKSAEDLTTLEEINRFYRDFAEPLLLQHVDLWRSSSITSSNLPALIGFYHAFSLVSSRAFLVDAYHGLSMVPIADAFNHALENHVHLESDYNVCPECGSLQECPHDYDQDGTTSKTESHGDHDLFYDMVSNNGIPPFSEIFNTYGEELTNAQLLNQYGFILDVNDNDRLSWTSEEIFRLLLPNDTSETDQKELFSHFQDITFLFSKDHPIFNQSRLIYYDDSFDGHFNLNGEGSLSHQLWSLFYTVALHRHHFSLTTASARQMLQAVLDCQVVLEIRLLGDDGDTVPRPTIACQLDLSILGILFEIGQMSVMICSHRKVNSGKMASHALDLSSVIEDLPDDATRTQLALSILISERSILDCCESEWRDLTTSLELLLDTD